MSVPMPFSALWAVIDREVRSRDARIAALEEALREARSSVAHAGAFDHLSRAGIFPGRHGMGTFVECEADWCRRSYDKLAAIDALLDASQSVKPPVLPEPDLRLMGEAVKGGKYPEQPVKP